MLGFGKRRRAAGFNSPSTFRQYAGLATFSFFTVLFSGVALVFNAALVFALYQGSLQFLPPWFAMVQLGQLILFVGPMLLLFLEWLLWDYVSVRFRSHK
jgi:hypothetical protein